MLPYQVNFRIRCWTCFIRLIQIQSERNRLREVMCFGQESIRTSKIWYNNAAVVVKSNKMNLQKHSCIHGNGRPWIIVGDVISCNVTKNVGLYDPSSLLWMFSLLLKELNFLILFAFTAAGVVPCGGRKTSPRTSTIVQFIFYFWSFEISVNILRNRK